MCLYFEKHLSVLKYEENQITVLKYEEIELYHVFIVLCLMKDNGINDDENTLFN